MWEVIFGIFIGLGYAMVFPESIAKLKSKVLKMIGHEKCDDDKDKPKRPNKWRDH